MTEAQIPHLMTALENLERGNKTDTTSIIARNTLKKLKGCDTLELEITKKGSHDGNEINSDVVGF